MKSKWLSKLLIASLVGIAPYFFAIVFFDLRNGEEFAFCAAVGCGVSAGVFCRVWSLLGAALSAVIIFDLVAIFGNTYGDIEIVLIVGGIALTGYAAGLLIGIPLGYLYRRRASLRSDGDVEVG